MIEKVYINNWTRDEWLEERKKSLGGSDMGAVLGLNPYSSPYSVWAEKTGKVPPAEENEAMRQGKDLEDYVAKRFTELTSKKVHKVNAIVRNTKCPHLHANLDRAISNEKSGLECKTASALSESRFKGGNFPTHYYAQCVTYLAITEYTRWYLAVLILGREFKVYQMTRIENDTTPEWCEGSVYVSDEEISALKQCAVNFWKHVIEDIPPELDGAKATEEAMKVIYADSKLDLAVGDYAFMLSKSAAAGEGYTEEQLENLKQLSEIAEVLSYNLNQLMAELERGEISIAALSSADSAAEGALQENMKVVESEFPEVPELIYDGPFSQHIETMKPLYIEGKDEVSKENAVKAVSSLMELPSYSFAVSGVSEGNLPFYMIEAESEDKTVYAEVSVQGGVVLEIMVSRNVGEAAITQEKAVELAREFLKNAGYESMRESYYMTNGNVCTVNFAYTQDGVVCYPDLIKVSVALDNGEIVGFETTGYVMSHTERALPDISVSAEEAEEKVSDELEVLAHNLAVIPTDGKYEVMCHEFICETEDDRHCIVYVNAETGAEEKILILIESESGTLTK